MDNTPETGDTSEFITDDDSSCNCSDLVWTSDDESSVQESSRFTKPDTVDSRQPEEAERWVHLEDCEEVLASSCNDVRNEEQPNSSNQSENQEQPDQIKDQEVILVQPRRSSRLALKRKAEEEIGKSGPPKIARVDDCMQIFDSWPQLFYGVRCDLEEEEVNDPNWVAENVSEISSDSSDSYSSRSGNISSEEDEE